MFSLRFGVFSSFSFLFLLVVFVQQEWKFSELLFISFYDTRSSTMIHITCVCLLKGKNEKRVSLCFIDTARGCLTKMFFFFRRCSGMQFKRNVYFHCFSFLTMIPFVFMRFFSVKRLFKSKFDVRWEIFWLFCFWNSRKMSEKYEARIDWRRKY